jgi:hemerythrin-like metal-binding protein
MGRVPARITIKCNNLAMLPTSEVSALVAIENATTRRLVVSLLRESGYGVLAETKDPDHTLLHLRRGEMAKFNIIICDRLGGTGHVSVLKSVRWSEGVIPQSLPVIGVDGQWTADELIAARDAGISATLTLPLTKRSLQMAVSTAIGKQKSFIAAPTFRGPDRRAAVISGYKGPFRRADDALTRRLPGSPVITQSQAAGEKKDPPHEAKPPAAAREHGKAEIEWSMAIATGRDDIDEQHKKIIELLKDLGRPSEKNDDDKIIDSVVLELNSYVKMHFSHEEQLMDTFDYDERDNHKQIHAGFIKKLDSFNIDDLRSAGRRERLFFIVYNWLVSHIVTIDRVMIAKMTGEYDDSVGADTIRKQTGVVIGDAFDLASQIMNIQMMAGRTSSSSKRTAYINDISSSTERLINLMELADSRVQVCGCSTFQLRRLGEIRSALATSADSLAEVAARRVITFCRDILSGKQGIPLGVGDVLHRHLGRVSSLAAVIGGADAMSASARGAAAEASELAGKVFEMGAGSVASLRSFESEGP